MLLKIHNIFAAHFSRYVVYESGSIVAVLALLCLTETQFPPIMSRCIVQLGEPGV